MDTTEHIINRLTSVISECSATLANPMSTKADLINANDKVLGMVSTCNAMLGQFTEQQRKDYTSLYDKATTICHRTRRLAMLLK
jgi:hypothetical protein